MQVYFKKKYMYVYIITTVAETAIKTLKPETQSPSLAPILECLLLNRQLASQSKLQPH